MNLSEPFGPSFGPEILSDLDISVGRIYRKTGRKFMKMFFSEKGTFFTVANIVEKN